MALFLPRRWKRKPPLGAAYRLDENRANGLVGFWGMVEGGGPTLHDLSGNGNTGTYNGLDSTSWVNGQNGPALAFNGTSQYVSQNGAAFDFVSNPWSMSVWVKTSTATQGAVVLMAGNSSSPNQIAGIQLSGPSQAAIDGVKAVLRSSAGNTEIYSTGSTVSIIDGKWHYLVVTWNKTNLRFYVDGTEKTSQYNLGLPTTASTFNTLTTGALVRTTTGLYTAGSIDDVRIFNRALSAGWVAEEYENPNGIWVPNLHKRYFSVPSGLPTLTSISASNITSTGARLTVS